MANTKKTRANEAQQTARLNTRVPDALREEVHQRAKDSGALPSDIVRDALAVYVGRPDLGTKLVREAA